MTAQRANPWTSPALSYPRHEYKIHRTWSSWEVIWREELPGQKPTFASMGGGYRSRDHALMAAEDFALQRSWDRTPNPTSVLDEDGYCVTAFLSGGRADCAPGTRRPEHRRNPLQQVGSFVVWHKTAEGHVHGVGSSGMQYTVLPAPAEGYWILLVSDGLHHTARSPAAVMRYAESLEVQHFFESYWSKPASKTYKRKSNPWTPPSQLWPRVEYRLKRLGGAGTSNYAILRYEPPNVTQIGRTYKTWDYSFSEMVEIARDESEQNPRNPNPYIVRSEDGTCRYAFVAGRHTQCPQPNPWNPQWPRYEYRIKRVGGGLYDIITLEHIPGQPPRMHSYATHASVDNVVHLTVVTARGRSMTLPNNPNPVIVYNDVGRCIFAFQAGQRIDCP